MNRPALTAFLLLTLSLCAWGDDSNPLWNLARAHQDLHRFSTLFTAQDVRGQLANDSGLAQAVDWCKKTAVTHVYIESFRDGYEAPREALLKAKQRFADEGFLVSGCITPTQVGKRSTGWSPISCYTDPATQDRVQGLFERAAALFDEIMIDDFWFTDCQCPSCDAARKARSAQVGTTSYPVTGDTWEDYRCELMTRISQDRILAPARKVNPKVQIIIKYPQWYDNFHERGYEVIRESAAFDRIWVGTETRDYADKQWGGTPQYEAYFIMRWLGAIGGAKCGGGWFDPYGTTPPTYLEQARQTVLGGARESLLFCYGSLQSQTGPRNIEALRTQIPELLGVAEQVSKRKIVGIAAYKPANSHGEKEKRIYDFVGMLGLPLVPCHEFPTDAPSAFFPIHALKDPQLVERLSAFIAAGKPVLITDALAKALEGKLDLNKPNVKVLPVNGDPKSLLNLPPDQANALRAFMKIDFQSPTRVALYIYADGSSVIENFNDDPVTVELSRQSRQLPARGWLLNWK